MIIPNSFWTIQIAKPSLSAALSAQYFSEFLERNRDSWSSGFHDDNAEAVLDLPEGEESGKQGDLSDFHGRVRDNLGARTRRCAVFQK